MSCDSIYREKCFSFAINAPVNCNHAGQDRDSGENVQVFTFASSPQRWGFVFKAKIAGNGKTLRGQTAVVLLSPQCGLIVRLG